MQWFRKQAICVYSKEGKPTTEIYCQKIYSPTQHEKFPQAAHGYWIHMFTVRLFSYRSMDAVCPLSFSRNLGLAIESSSTSTHSYGFSSFRQAVPSRVGLDSENMCRTRSCGGGKGRVGNSLWRRRRRILENRWCGAAAVSVSQSWSSWGIPFSLSQRFPSSLFRPFDCHCWPSPRLRLLTSYNVVVFLSFPPNASTYFHEAHKRIVCFRVPISQSLLAQPMQSLQSALNEPNSCWKSGKSNWLSYGQLRES